MEDPKTDTPVRFDINAAVVFRLGEELITDEVQALVELVKNSYDADASWVKVMIDTRSANQWSERYASSQGVIVVEDDGDGMDQKAIKDGWLTIANSPKRGQKAKGVQTRRGRTPIGDKGLGRLGVQRLASNVEIFTRPRDEAHKHYVAFSWRDFRNTESLSHVPVTFEQRACGDERPGTQLILSDLRDPETWRGEKIHELQRSLSGMISPFKEVKNFIVHLELDGKRLELAEIALRVRETALLRYSFDFDGTTFKITGKTRLNFLQPNAKDDRTLLASLYRRDDGKTLFDFLSTKAKRKRPSVFTRSRSAGWFVEFETKRQLDCLDKAKRVDGQIANPGPFRGEVDAVSLDRTDVQGHVLDRYSEYRKLVQSLAGVRVYRDGFGIRVGDDWLGLGRQWTSAPSYYGLKPGNVLGYVAISARDNAMLIETTSREGFQVTPHYENFYALLAEFVRFSGSVQEFLRRGTLDFLNEYKDRTADVEPTDSPGDITRRIEDVASTLGDKHKRLQSHVGRLRSVVDHATSTLVEVRKEIDGKTGKDPGLQRAIGRLDVALGEVSVAATSSEALFEEVSGPLSRASELSSLGEVLDRRWDRLKEEIDAVYESVSLALTAEVLSHEIHNIADGLAQRSATMLRQLRAGDIRRSTIVTYIEQVRSAVAGMRKQLAHMTPSLKYLRERREDIDLVPFLNELAAFHNERLTGKGVTVEVSAAGGDVTMRMNRGKLTQVFDNLILNADYWLREAIRTGHIKAGVISIMADGPIVRVADNGRGVDPAVEQTLFDPFVTMKEKSEGRGLGLFVVQQLLDSEGCTALLLPERNSFGRRFAFELDFTGAVGE
jgi:signal transduction histidine kinase